MEDSSAEPSSRAQDEVLSSHVSPTSSPLFISTPSSPHVVPVTLGMTSDSEASSSSSIPSDSTRLLRSRGALSSLPFLCYRSARLHSVLPSRPHFPPLSLR